MEEGWLPGVLCVICCPLDNGLLPCITASCPPAPSNMEIGRWLPLDREGKKEDLWVEAYTCCLQHMAEASARRSLETEGEGMVPQVSPLVQAFLAATGRRVSPSSGERMLAVEERYHPKTAHKHSLGPYNPLSR